MKTSSTRSSEALLLMLALALGTGALGADKAEAVAKARFNEGRKAYDLGQFEEALVAYSDAYKAKPLPALLFNIAQCHKNLGNFERAAFFYQRYLDLEKNAKNEATARELLAEVKQKQAAKEARELELARLAAAGGAAAAEPRPAEPPSPLVPAPAAPAPSAVTPATADLAAAAPPAPAPSADGAITGKWWFWTGVGVLVAGGATAAVVATRPRPQVGSLEEINAR